MTNITLTNFEADALWTLLGDGPEEVSNDQWTILNGLHRRLESEV